MRHALKLGSMTTTVIAALALPLLAARAAEPAADTAADAGAPALAERLSDTARLTLSTKYPVAPHWKMAAALLEGANKLNPSESRYSRLWADAMLQAGDTDG